MQKIAKRFWLGPLVSGILTFIAVCQINFFVSWICYVPLFISISNASSKNTFKKAFLFGLVLSTVAFFWMIPGAERFTGHSILYGIGVFLISALFFAFYQAVLFWCFGLLKKREDNTRSIIINSLLIASLVCVGEALMMIVSQGFPWFNIHSGSGLAGNLYAIQPAAVLGVHVLSFWVVIVNFLAGYFIVRKLYARLYIPVVILIFYLFAGFVQLNSFNNISAENKSVNVAILAENIPPDIKWDDNNGDMLVQRIFSLNRSAVAMKPDMILWSESAIPWTYSKDDDLVKEVLSITGSAHVTHIMGINTAISENEVFNSAYCILPDGNVTGRYDKQYLLALIEKPFNGLLMPFFSSKGFIARNNKAHAAPLSTPFGKAGMLICNEAAIPAAAAGMVKQGARFLFNISNDGWFNDTYIVRLHYYYARLRAVESRKDLAINCNNGYSGLINASGAIIEQERSEDPFVKIVAMQPNSIISTATALPNLFVYFCAAYLVIFAVVGFINFRKQRQKSIVII